ncbi:MAG: hypothetical protein R2706_17860 [Acidimicrobiales bacterium]
MRREAMTEHSELGIDCGAALRPFYERAVAFRREMDRGIFREHDEEEPCHHWLRGPAHLTALTIGC